MFPLIAKRIGNWAITGVRRFAEAWEREASLRLREGDVMALGDYQAHGRIYDGPQDRVYDDAVDLYMADVAAGKSSLLLAGTNDEAAQLARMVRERRIERGQIAGAREVTLSDGNAAGRRRPGARPAEQQDRRWRAAAHEPGHAAPGRLPGNREGPHRARRAADRARGVVRPVRASGDLPRGERRARLRRQRLRGPGPDGRHRATWWSSETLSRDQFYVGMTRGRERNIAHVVTGPPTRRACRGPSGRPTPGPRSSGPRRCSGAATRPGPLAVSVIPPEPEGMRERAPWEAVLAGIMHRDDPAVAALEEMKAAQDYAMNTRHLLTLSEAFWWKEVGAADRRGGTPAHRPARVRAVPGRPGAARAPAGAQDARDRRPRHRGQPRRDHGPHAGRRPVDRRGASRPPGKRTAPGCGGRRGPGLSGAPQSDAGARRRDPAHAGSAAGRARPRARRTAAAVGAPGVGRSSRAPGVGGEAGGLGKAGRHRRRLPRGGRDHRPGAGDRAAAREPGSAQGSVPLCRARAAAAGQRGAAAGHGPRRA